MMAPHWPREVYVKKRLSRWVLFIGLAVVLFIVLLNWPSTHHWQIPFNDFVQHLEADRVRHVTVGKDELHGEFASPQPVGRNRTPRTQFRVRLPEGTTGDWALMEWLLGHNASIEVDRISDVGDRLLALIPWVLLFGFIWYFVFRQMRKSQSAASTGPPADAVRVFVVNQPGEPPLSSPPTPSATTTTEPPPPLPPTTPAPGGDN
jgi:ATP-dependent Zn protease